MFCTLIRVGDKIDTLKYFKIYKVTRMQELG